MNKATQAYLATKVSTTDQGQLLLMLYDGALKFLQQAREKMLEKDYAAKGLLISKVIDIVNELSNTLNLEKGGTLAQNLNNLYFLCTTRLLQANLKMNVEQLDNVATILSGLRNAYAEIITTPEARQVAAQIATKMNSDASMLQRAAIPSSQKATAMPGLPGQLGQMQARAAYGQVQRAAAVAANASSGMASNMPPAAAPAQAALQQTPMAPVEVQNVTAPESLAQTSAATETTVPMTPPTQGSATTAQATQTAMPAPATTVITPPAPGKGFGGASFAQLKAYGK